MPGGRGATLSFEEKLARIEDVTPQAVSSLARTIFRPERLTVAAVGQLDGDLEPAVRAVVEQFR